MHRADYAVETKVAWLSVKRRCYVEMVIYARISVTVLIYAYYDQTTF